MDKWEISPPSVETGDCGDAYRVLSSSPGVIKRVCKLAAASPLGVALVIAAACGVAAVRSVRASTYVVYVALDDPVYQELDTLNGLGLLDDYLSEVRPIARVEAARLVLEAEHNLDDAEEPAPLARSIIKSMRAEFSEEVEWLEQNHEDNPPTMFHPLERVEAQYVYSDGTRRHFALSARIPPSIRLRKALRCCPTTTVCLRRSAATSLCAPPVGAE